MRAWNAKRIDPNPNGLKGLWDSFLFSFESLAAEKPDESVFELHLIGIRHNRHYSGLLALVLPPPDDDTLASVILGPTGNLKAPTLRLGDTLLVGFGEPAYEQVLGG